MFIILILILSFITINTVGCGYHLRYSHLQIPNKLKIIILNSYDPYGLLTRMIRSELHLNDVTIIDNINNYNINLPSLYIINYSEKKIISSVFPDGKVAEYKIISTIQTKISISNKNYRYVNIKIAHSFCDNPLTALAKNAELDNIQQELYKQIAHELINKLLILYYRENSK